MVVHARDRTADFGRYGRANRQGQTQHRLHPGRRSGLRRCGLLQRTVEDSHAQPRPPGPRGHPLHRRPCAGCRLYAHALRPADGPLLLPLADEVRRAAALGRTAHRGGPAHRARAAAPTRLCHDGYWQVALGLGLADEGRPARFQQGRTGQHRLRPAASAGGPTTRGFDAWFGVDLPNYPPYCFIQNDHTVGVPSLAAPMQKGGFNRPGPMLPGWSLTNIMPEITRHAVCCDRGFGQDRGGQAVLSVLRADRAALSGRARARVQGPQPGGRLWRLRGPGGLDRGRGARRLGPHRLGRQHAGDLHQRQRAGMRGNRSRRLCPHPAIRAPQHGRAPRRETRRLGRRPSRGLHRALAGADPRRASPATRRSATWT